MRPRDRELRRETKRERLKDSDIQRENQEERQRERLRKGYSPGGGCAWICMRGFLIARAFGMRVRGNWAFQDW